MSPRDVRPRNTLGVLAELAAHMAGDGAAEQRYADNHVLHRLHAHADAVRASGLPILLRCGDRDVFNLPDRELEAAWHEWAAQGRQGAPPRLDAFGVTGPGATRVLLEPELTEQARRDPTAARRYGPAAPR